MKKILLTLLLALPFCMVAKAQDFRVGITGGYNLSSPSGYKSQSGFHAGVKGELGLPQVTKGLYMDFGLMLSSHGWKSPGYYYNGNYNPSTGEKTDKPSSGYTSGNKCTLYYLSIPLHTGYKFSIGRNISMFVNAGPYFNIGLFGKAKETITANNGTISQETTSNVFSDKMRNRFDWGLGFRAGTEIARHVQLSVGYDWGMKNIYKNDVDCKNKTFVASCAYMF